LELFLLGPPHVKRDGQPIKIGLRKATALLAYLALTRQSHARNTLATLFWPESNQSSARASLRKALSHLKKALGEEWLEIDRENLALNRRHSLWLDTDRFSNLLSECRSHGHAADDVCLACLGPLAEAVTLYRDSFMAGFTLRDSPSFDEWQVLQSEHLHHQMSGALEHLAQGLAAQNKFDQALRYARRWLTLDPLHEEAHRCLMWLYAQTGQNTAALRQYDACTQVLERELGVSPHTETRQLYLDIKEKGALRPSDPISASHFACPHNLPLHPTPFVGRKDELARIHRLLNDPSRRLVTVTGVGGVGKTRLALQAATQAVHEKSASFPNGVYLVPLAPLDSADHLVPAIANALEFSFYKGADPKTQLLNYLRRKEMLLVLDNFEHLLDGTKLLVEILSSVPGIRLLATSRERLNLQWESPIEIRGLEVPQSDTTGSPEACAAVKLFLQRANRISPDFRLSETTQTHVARICRHLEGIPLAIELAAASVETLSCQEIARMIARPPAHIGATSTEGGAAESTPLSRMSRSSIGSRCSTSRSTMSGSARTASMRVTSSGGIPCCAVVCSVCPSSNRQTIPMSTCIASIVRASDSDSNVARSSAWLATADTSYRAARSRVRSATRCSSVTLSARASSSARRRSAISDRRLVSEVRRDRTMRLKAVVRTPISSFVSIGTVTSRSPWSTRATPCSRFCSGRTRLTRKKSGKPSTTNADAPIIKQASGMAVRWMSWR
jgi:DNA-binding SARP family transcriptional activator